MVDVVERWSGSRSDRLAFAFLDVRCEIRARVSYGELAARAQRIAAELGRWVPPGGRALLVFPPGLDFIEAFFGCLYAGVVAVPVYPPRSAEDAPRLAGIVASARPEVVLSTRAFHDRIEPALRSIAELAAVVRVAVDDLADVGPWTQPALGPSSLAFLQYTSGSTGRPRGVMVAHGNLVANERVIRERTGHDPERTVFAGWLPLYHDMGLIGNVLQSAYLGIPCYLMSPLDFIKRPSLWLEAISRYRVSTSGGPSFAYDHCTRRIPDDPANLDLSSWDLAFNGAEPVRADVLDRFVARFARCGFRRETFYPCYGLAEATLMVTGSDKLRGPEVLGVERGELGAGRVARAQGSAAQALVACGRPTADHTVVIVDRDAHTLAAPGRVGEIWVAGPSVCAGYWNDDQATAESFGATLPGQPGRFLRTGDLGFLEAGQLFVVGRRKDLIIVRGCNHYPEDIERTLERAHPALRPGCGVVFGIDHGGEERVVAVHEATRGSDGATPSQICAALIEAVAARHGLRLHAAVLVKPGAIPKTSSGKLRRGACRASYLEGRLEVLDG